MFRHQNKDQDSRSTYWWIIYYLKVVNLGTRSNGRVLIFIDREVDWTYDELEQGRLILEKIPGRYICNSKKLRMTISVREF